MGDRYIIWNAPMPTTAGIVAVTTGTAIKTMLQIKGAVPFWVVEWGVSLSGFAAAAPGVVELLTTGAIAATVTASAAADIMPYGDANAPANTAGASGVPFNLSTTATGYTSTGEGTIVATRVLAGGLMAPTTQFVQQFPLGERPHILLGTFLRVRVTFAAAVNCSCYCICEV
jgi:hypothetical protein